MIVLVPLIALLGLAIGSFLNVVIWRVPRGESVVTPASACPHCEKEIRARYNVPVIGWLVLRGRCHDCGESISPRYPLVEAGAGLLFLTIALRFGVDPVLPAFLYLVAVGLALALIDTDTRKLPDVLVLPSYAVAVALLGVATVFGDDADGSDFLRAVLGGAAMYAFYFVIVFAYPKGMGFGDVKLAGVLGLYTAWIGWGAWAVGVFGGFLFGGVWGIALIAGRKGGRRSKIPYGPFMLAGVLGAVLWGQELADWYLDVTVH